MPLLQLLLLLLLAATAAAARSTEPVEEHLVKAELVERFTRFVEWPPESFDDPGSAFVIGLVGGDPFRGSLEEVAAGRELRGHPIRVRRLSLRDPLEECCHLLFLAPSAVERLETILERVGDRPILTIADAPGLGERGVVINLVRQDDRIAFEINQRAVERSGLGVSSKLLRLARLVGRGAE